MVGGFPQLPIHLCSAFSPSWIFFSQVICSLPAVMSRLVLFHCHHWDMYIAVGLHHPLCIWELSSITFNANFIKWGWIGAFKRWIYGRQALLVWDKLAKIGFTYLASNLHSLMHMQTLANEISCTITALFLDIDMSACFLLTRFKTHTHTFFLPQLNNHTFQLFELSNKHVPVYSAIFINRQFLRARWQGLVRGRKTGRHYLLSIHFFGKRSALGERMCEGFIRTRFKSQVVKHWTKLQSCCISSISLMFSLTSSLSSLLLLMKTKPSAYRI